MVVKLFTAKLSEISDAAVRAVMTNLCLLYALHGISKHTGDFLQVSVSLQPFQITRENALSYRCETKMLKLVVSTAKSQKSCSRTVLVEGLIELACPWHMPETWVAVR